MSTTAEVQAEIAKIFTNSTLSSITPNAYGYTFGERSETEVRKYYHNQRINFFQYEVTRKIMPMLMGEERNEYQVAISYYYESYAGVATEQSKVKDAIEKVYTTIKSVLGRTWNNTIDYYTIEDSFIPIEVVTLDQKEVLKGQINIIGIKSQCL